MFIVLVMSYAKYTSQVFFVTALNCLGPDEHGANLGIMY